MFGDTLMKAEGVRHQYGTREVLRLENWALRTGENQCLLGPSGSGKTTLLSALTGLLRPTEGEVHIAGQALFSLTGVKRDRLRAATIGLVLQDHHLVSSLTLMENLAFAQFIAGRGDDTAWANELLDRLQLRHRRDAKPHSLSRGETQRAAIARATINRPPILIADEPRSALDDDNAHRVISLLTDLCSTCGATLLVATHDSRIRHHFDKRLTLPAPIEAGA
jgi:putative ABC transport system ATP-binding protein